MNNKFKKGTKVIVCGFGEVEGKYYKCRTAYIVERDPYYKNYLVKFKDGTEDWISPEFMHKPNSKKEQVKK